jgi:hypothetical protein
VSTARLIKQLSRQSVTLPAATRAARASGDIAASDAVSVTIRKVQVGEVIALVPTPPSVFRLAALQAGTQDDPEAARARLEQAILDDPTLAQAGQQQQRDTVRAIVALGVTSERVLLTSDDSPDALVPEDFGDDLAHLHDAIVAWSSLPYTRLGGADGIGAFPGEPVGNPPVADGEVLRHDPVEADGA